MLRCKGGFPLAAASRRLALSSGARTAHLATLSSTPVVQQEAAAAAASASAPPPPLPPASSPAAPAGDASSARQAASNGAGASSSAPAFTRDQMTERILEMEMGTWAYKQSHLSRLAEEHTNVLALSQTAPQLSSVGVLAPGSTPLGASMAGVGYWRGMARMLLLRRALSPADIANPAPYATLSYQEMAALEENEAADRATQVAGKEREGRDSILAAFEAANAGEGSDGSGGDGGDGKGSRDAAAAAAEAAELARESEATWGRGLMAAIDDAVAQEEAEQAARAGVKQRKRTAAEAGKGGAVMAELLEDNSLLDQSSSSSSSSSGSESEGGAGAGAGRSAGSDSEGSTSGGAGTGSAAGSANASGYYPPEWHLAHDVSPPVTGALTYARMTAKPLGAAADAGAAAVEQALVEGRGHPAPSVLHPAATLWLTAAVAHLRETRARLAHNLAEGRAAAGAGRLSPAALAAAGMPLAAAEAVVSTLATVPLSSLPAADKAWLRSLTVEQLELLLAQVAARRRGVTAPGSLLAAASASDKATAAAAAAAVDASPLAARIKRVESVLGVLTAAKAGAPLEGADAAHLVRYPTLRALHSQLLAAVMPPATASTTAEASASAASGLGAASAETPIPGFSDRQSAAAARLAQYRGVLGLELARLQAAMAQASAVVAATDPAADETVVVAGADAATAAADGMTPTAAVLPGGTHALVDLPMPASAAASAGAADAAPTITRIARALPSAATPSDEGAGLAAVARANASAGAAAGSALGAESDGEAAASKAAAAARPASAAAAETASASAAASETYSGAAGALAKRLNEGHVPSALQPLSLILTPAEWSSLVTSVLMTVATRAGNIHHPPAFKPAAPAAGAGAGAGADGVTLADPTNADEEVALAQASAAAQMVVGLRSLLESEETARATLEATLKAMEEKYVTSEDPQLKNAAAKAREQVQWMLNAAKQGAFDGREGTLGRMLSTVMAASEDMAHAAEADEAAAAAASGEPTRQKRGAPKLSTRSTFRDLPALFTYYMRRHNAATPEGVMGRAVVTPWDLMDEESSAVATMASLAHLAADCTGNNMAAMDGYYRSGGPDAAGGASLSSLTQMVPLPLESAARLPLPRLTLGLGDGPDAPAGGAGAAALLHGIRSSVDRLPGAQALLDPETTNPLLALAPTPSLMAHAFYAPADAAAMAEERRPGATRLSVAAARRDARSAPVPAGNGRMARVPLVPDLPPELSVVSVYGIAGSPTSPAATRVVDEWVATAARRRRDEAAGIETEKEGVPSGVTRHSTDERTAETALLASDALVGSLIDSAIRRLRGRSEPGAGPEAGGSSSASASAAGSSSSSDSEGLDTAAAEAVLAAARSGVADVASGAAAAASKREVKVEVEELLPLTSLDMTEGPLDTGRRVRAPAGAAAAPAAAARSGKSSAASSGDATDVEADGTPAVTFASGASSSLVEAGADDVAGVDRQLKTFIPLDRLPPVPTVEEAEAAEAAAAAAGGAGGGAGTAIASGSGSGSGSGASGSAPAAAASSSAASPVAHPALHDDAVLLASDLQDVDFDPADDVTTATGGGVPTVPSTDPARTRAAAIESLLSATIRVAAVKAEAAGVLPGAAPDSLEGGTAEAISGFLTGDLVRSVQRALITGEGVPVVRADGSVALVDPLTGNAAAGIALQWRQNAYKAAADYRGPIPGGAAAVSSAAVPYRKKTHSGFHSGEVGSASPSADSSATLRRIREGHLATGDPLAGEDISGAAEAYTDAFAAAEEGGAGSAVAQSAAARAAAAGLTSVYGSVHFRIGEAMAARDLGAAWALFTEHKRLAPQEGDPDFLLYEMMMDACARARRPDLVLQVLWPEVNRLQMVATENMLFLLFKAAALAGDLPTAERLYGALWTTGAAKVTRSHLLALVSCALEAGNATKAVFYFNQLKRQGHEADPEVYSLLLARLASAGRMEDVHHVWLALCKSPNMTVPRWLYTQLIVTFARAGAIADMEAAEARMARRLDRFQRPEPLAVAAMVDAYLAAGLLEPAQDRLGQLLAMARDEEAALGTGKSTSGGVMSVGLQTPLGNAVGAHVRAATAAAAAQAAQAAAASGARPTPTPTHAQLLAAQALASLSNGYVARGVPDCAVEGMVAAFCRPQAVPPAPTFAAQTAAPAAAVIGPSPVPAGLLAIPAPALLARISVGPAPAGAADAGAASDSSGSSSDSDGAAAAAAAAGAGSDGEDASKTHSGLTSDSEASGWSDAEDVLAAAAGSSASASASASSQSQLSSRATNPSLRSIRRMSRRNGRGSGGSASGSRFAGAVNAAAAAAGGAVDPARLRGAEALTPLPLPSSLHLLYMSASEAARRAQAAVAEAAAIGTSVLSHAAEDGRLEAAIRRVTEGRGRRVAGEVAKLAGLDAAPFLASDNDGDDDEHDADAAKVKAAEAALKSADASSGAAAAGEGSSDSDGDGSELSDGEPAEQSGDEWDENDDASSPSVLLAQAHALVVRGDATYAAVLAEAGVAPLPGSPPELPPAALADDGGDDGWAADDADFIARSALPADGSPAVPAASVADTPRIVRLGGAWAVQRSGKPAVVGGDVIHAAAMAGARAYAPTLAAAQAAAAAAAQAGAGAGAGVDEDLRAGASELLR